ncbi:MAG: extensin family protein [Hyphomicrobiaceae bacterium]|nr:MAG: extensin family protein [Hyphomicrobiaceae bacterium]
MYQLRVCIALLLAALTLWGCSQQPRFVARDEPWRADEERACLASGAVRETHFIAARSGLGGPSVCGALRPFSVSATAQGWVQLRPAALLRCPMVPAVDHWVQRVVMPAARYHLGVPVVELKVAASYSCRPMNHVNGARLSEHGHANAIDISGFVLANGHTITVKTGWWGAFAERNFLRSVHQGACDVFTTVLGPNYDANHRDHFHLDLARHGRDGTNRICK